MSTSSPPPPPSPDQILGTSEKGATAQLNQQNIPAQAGSQYAQQDPYGALNYTIRGVGPGGVPLYSASTEFSPSQQQAFQNTTGTQLEAGGQRTWLRQLRQYLTKPANWRYDQRTNWPAYEHLAGITSTVF